MRALFALLLCAPSLAQSGTLDQVSPFVSATFNVNMSTLRWQQQVRAGISGQLEGFDMPFIGPAGAHVDAALRLGDGWNTGPAIWTGGFTKSLMGFELQFFDVTAANIVLTAGDTLVIELVGNDTGMVLRGSHVDPAVNSPYYPEELYLNGPSCFGDCGWRFAFRTWMLDSPIGTNYCGPALPNSSGQAAQITAVGSDIVANNDVTLTATGLPAGQFGYFLAGQTQGSFNPPGSQGIICLSGNIGRYNQVANIIQGPTGSIQLDLTAVPVNPPQAVQPGETWNFQCWYRDSNPTLTSNFTDAVSVTFQ